MNCEKCKAEIPASDQQYVRIGGELLPYEICRKCQRELNQKIDEYPAMKVRAAGGSA